MSDQAKNARNFLFNLYQQFPQLRETAEIRVECASSRIVIVVEDQTSRLPPITAHVICDLRTESELLPCPVANVHLVAPSGHIVYPEEIRRMAKMLDHVETIAAAMEYLVPDFETWSDIRAFQAALSAALAPKAA